MLNDFAILEENITALSQSITPYSYMTEICVHSRADLLINCVSAHKENTSSTKENQHHQEVVQIPKFAFSSL